MAALLNHTRWLNGRYGLGPHDRVLLKTALSFDASVWELISPLSSGATLVVAPGDVPGDVAALARLLGEQAIGVVQLVPSLLAALLERAELSAARALRLVFCGGEALAPGLARRFRERLPWAASAQSLWSDRGDHRRDRVVVRATTRRAAAAACRSGRRCGGVGLCAGRGSGLVPEGVVGELYLGGLGWRGVIWVVAG